MHLGRDEAGQQLFDLVGRGVQIGAVVDLSR